jgi:hypothetical protein
MHRGKSVALNILLWYNLMITAFPDKDDISRRYSAACGGASKIFCEFMALTGIAASISRFRGKEGLYVRM